MPVYELNDDLASWANRRNQTVEKLFRMKRRYRFHSDPEDRKDNNQTYSSRPH